MMDRNDEAAAKNVVRTTTIAELLKARTLPGLKPNHPNQRRRMDSVSQPGLRLGVTFGLSFNPFFRSSLNTCAMMPRPAAPAAACTMRPPAKSLMPIMYSQPVGFQIQAAGRFHMITKYGIEYRKKASSFIFLSVTIPTRARVTEAKAVSKRKYVPRLRFVAK